MVSRRSIVLAALVVSFASLLSACNGCGKRSTSSTPDAAASSSSAPRGPDATRTKRRMGADRATAKTVTIEELVKDTTVDPSGSTPHEEGDLFRFKGVVVEIKPNYVLFQDGAWAATCELPSGVVPPPLAKGDAIEVTGFYLRGGGHVAARVADCEIKPR